MNVNELFDITENIGLQGVMQEIGIQLHDLTETKTLILGVAAVIGLLLCLLGLKLVRVWAALIGLACGFAAGITAGRLLNLNELGVLITGAVLGIILAVLGGVLYRVGVFLLVFITVSGFCIYVINPREWLSASVCLAIGLVAGILAIWFVIIFTILATSLFGGMVSGTAVYYLLPVTGEVILIALCAVFCIIGILVQLLLESTKQKKKNLEKAAEIREEKSTANEVEKARAMMENLDKISDEDLEEDDLMIMDLDDENSEKNEK